MAINTLLVANLSLPKMAIGSRIIFLLINLRNCMRAKFMAICIKILHLTIVSPLVGDVESAGYRAAIRIFPPPFKNFFVVHFIQIVHSIVECYQNYLWDFVDR